MMERDFIIMETFSVISYYIITWAFDLFTRPLQTSFLIYKYRFEGVNFIVNCFHNLSINITDILH